MSGLISGIIEGVGVNTYHVGQFIGELFVVTLGVCFFILLICCFFYAISNLRRKL